MYFFLYGGALGKNHKSSDNILRANAGLHLLLGATSDLLYPNITVFIMVEQTSPWTYWWLHCTEIFCKKQGILLWNQSYWMQASSIARFINENQITFNWQIKLSYYIA